MKLFFLILLIIPKIGITDDKILETLNLKDGRTLQLNKDGTFEYLKNKRVFEVNLINLRKPNQMESILGAAERDCTLVFEIKNMVGGTVLSYSPNVYAVNLDGKYINTMGGITHINAFSFEELSNSESSNATMTIQEMCKNVKQVFLESVDDQYCNYVGRRPSDICYSMTNVKSYVKGVKFTKDK